MHSRTDATEWYGNKKVEQEEDEMVKLPEDWCVAERQSNQQEKHYEWDYEQRLSSKTFLHENGCWVWMCVMTINTLKVRGTLLVYSITDGKKSTLQLHSVSF